ncbi:MAG: O-antigen ligase family protein [Desulfitobacteriaceae bacterium]
MNKQDCMLKKIGHYFFYLILVCVLSFGTFARGLYFEPEMRIHHYVVAVCLLIAVIPVLFFSIIPLKKGLVIRRRSCGISEEQVYYPFYKLVLSPYYLSILLLTVCYYMSFLVAVNHREAYFSWLRQLDYFLLFTLILFALRFSGTNWAQNKFVNLFLNISVCMGTLVALAGLADWLGVYDVNGSLVNGRIGSFFQYPNTMAAYLVATFVLSLYLTVTVSRAGVAGVYAVCGYLMLLAIMGSQSRGMWLLFPFILLLLFLGPLPRQRIVLIFFGLFVIAIICSAAVFSIRTPTSLNWLSITIGLLGMCGSILWGFAVVQGRLIAFANGLKRINKILWALLILGAIYLLCIFLITQNGQLINRLAAIRMDSGTLHERLIFAVDAWKMVIQRPLLGWGGGGWISAYHAYQSYYYDAADVHNHVMQVLLETGFPGLTAFLLSFFALILGMVRLWRRRSVPQAGRTWAIGSAAFALVLHSFIDFDFAFSSVYMFYWSLLAIFYYYEISQGFGTTAWFKLFWDKVISLRTMFNRTYKTYRVLWMLILIIISIKLFTGTLAVQMTDSTAQKIINAAKQGDLVSKEEMLKVTNNDLWDSADIVELAGIFATQYPTASQKGNVLLPYALALAQKGVALDSFNAGHRMMLARFYLSRGDYSLADAESRKAVNLQPWEIHEYENMLEVSLACTIRQWTTGNIDSLRNTLRQAVQAVEEGLSQEEILAPELKNLRSSHKSGLTLTPRLSLAVGQAYILLGEYNKAIPLLDRAVKGGDRTQQSYALLWQRLAREKMGDQAGHAANKIVQESEQLRLEEQAIRNLLKRI